MTNFTKFDSRIAGPLAGLIALLAGLLVGGVLVPVQDTVGLTNIAMVYMAIVCVAAAFGGHVGGVLAGLSAALCYNFLVTPPYLMLRIDSVDQVVTIVLLLAGGPATSVAANVARGKLRGRASTSLPYWYVSADPGHPIPRSGTSGGNSHPSTGQEPSELRPMDP